jgi:hypothetical protein
MKKIFKIAEHKPITAVWYYEVEAETEAEALELVQSGEADCIDYETIDNHSADYEYEVTGVVGKRIGKRK